MNPILLWYRTTPPALRAIMTVTVALYAAFLVVGLFASLVPALAPVMLVFDALAFNPARALTRPWSFLTHVVAYPRLGFGGLIGLVFGLMFLSTLGRDAESLRGSAYLLVAYFAAALGAALLALLAFGRTDAPVAMGPWPGVLGLAMALGVQYPDKTIGLFLIGSVRLIYVALGVVVLSMLVNQNVLAAIPEMGGVLAGAAVGFAGRKGLDPSGWLKNLMERRTEKASVRRSPVAERRRAEPERRAGGRASQAEVDRILDKISAHGTGALTDEERRILDDAARRG